MTKTNHRRTLQETPSQPNCVVHYEEEVSKDEGEDDLDLDPNQIAEFSRQLPEPAMDARQIETEIPIPIVEKESETVTDEIPASEKESENLPIINIKSSIENRELFCIGIRWNEHY